MGVRHLRAAHEPALGPGRPESKARSVSESLVCNCCVVILYGGARVIAIVMEAAARVVFVGILITSGRPDP